MHIADKEIYIYGEQQKSVPLVIVNTFDGDGSDIYAAIKTMTDKNFCMAVISNINWDDEMSPWESPALSKNDNPCTGGADKYLELLTQTILPNIIATLGNTPKNIIIAGYSLGGLFAIYSLYKTDIFSAAVSASGSLWFPNFVEYINTHKYHDTLKKVYFSLGDKESRTGHPILSTVEINTKGIFESFKNNGIDTIFELNPGNHFKDADIRLAKGITWILN